MRLVLIGALMLALVLLTRPTVPLAQGYLNSTPSPGAYLPVILVPAAAPTPGPTNTPTLPPPSFTNCEVDPGGAINYPVRIVTVFKDDEVVRLQNVSTATIDLTGWTMCSIRGGQTHTGIGGTLAPGETRDYAYTGGGSIWNNSLSDPGALYDAQGRLIAYWPN